MSKDVMLPGEMTFRRETFTASTPAAALRWSDEIDYLKSVLLVDFNLVLRTPIIPGKCRECSQRPGPAHPNSSSQLDSPTLPWCTHSGAPVNASSVAPIRSSANLMLF